MVGLITSKQEGGEGVGFAIPLAGMDWKTFVEPAKRTGNRERYKQAINLASRACMAGALLMSGNPGVGLPEQLAAAAYYSRLALTESPAGEDAFRGMIEMYYLVGKQDICLELARSASRATDAEGFCRCTPDRWISWGKRTKHSSSTRSRWSRTMARQARRPREISRGCWRARRRWNGGWSPIWRSGEWPHGQEIRARRRMIWPPGSTRPPPISRRRRCA